MNSTKILFMVFICILEISYSQVLNQPTRFIFEKKMTFSQEGINKLDSTKTDKVNGNAITGIMKSVPQIEIVIEVKNDSIWRHLKEKGKMIGDYYMITRSSGILHYYDKAKKINYRKFDLFAKDHVYDVIEDKNRIERIMGYDCYYLKLIKKNNDSDLGNTIYEMYVTNELKLPLHSIINITKYLPDCFPLKIIVSEAGLPGLSEVYELTDLK